MDSSLRVLRRIDHCEAPGIVPFEVTGGMIIARPQVDHSLRGPGNVDYKAPGTDNCEGTIGLIITSPQADRSLRGPWSLAYGIRLSHDS